MHNHSPDEPVKKTSFISLVKAKIMYWLRLTDNPIVRVYHGYGNKEHLLIFGHVLAFSPIPRKKFSGNIFTNAFALLRLFMVRPFNGAKVQLNWNGEVMEAITDTDGFFKFEWKPATALPTGSV